MITSDIEELNISDLNEYQKDRALLLTENEEGYWRKLTLDPNKSVNGTGSPFAYQDNEIISTSNVNESFVQRISSGEDYLDIFYDFSTGVPTWGLQTSDSSTFRWSPSNIGTDGGDPQISGDMQGNAFAIWTATNNSIRARRYDAATQSWDGVTATILTGGPGSNPDISLSESGIAIAVWEFNTGLSQIIQARSYDPDTQTWSSVITLSDLGENDFDPHVYINDTGDGVAVWSSAQSGNVIIQASLFDGTTKTWNGAPTNISSISGFNTNAKSGIDNNGNIVAIWNYDFSTTNILQYATYDKATTTWSTPSNLTNNPNDAYFPDLSVTSNGNAMAVWIESIGGGIYNVNANKYNGSTKNWNPSPYTIDTISSNFIYSPQVAMSNLGTAVAVWHIQVSTNPISYSVKASYYDNNTNTWATSESLANTSISNPSPRVGINDKGNVAAIWLQTDGQDPFVQNYFIQSSTYQNVIKTWSLPDQISDTEPNVYTPQVEVKGNRAIAVWGYLPSDMTPRIGGAPGIINPHILTANDSIVSFAFRKVQEVGEPEVDTDAATKFYVDSAIAAANMVFLKNINEHGLLKEGAIDSIKKKKSNKTSKKSKKKGEQDDNK